MPTTLAADCEPDEFSEQPRLYCFDDSRFLSFWYEAFPTLDEAKDEYQGWLTYYGIATDTADCFAVPIPLPCETGYKTGEYDPAGSVAGIVDENNSGWLFFTHEPALVFGKGLVNLNGTQTYADMFGYWVSDASRVVYPPPTP